MAISETPYATPWSTRLTASWRDFGLVVLGALALLALIIFSETVPLLGPVRLLLGLVYVLYVPGYCLTAALFPQHDDLDAAERTGLSIGLSVAIVSLLALLLDRLPWGLQLWPILLGEYSVIALCSLVALGRRVALGSDAHAPDIHWRPRRWWRELPQLERRVYLLVAGTLLVAGLCGAWVLLVPAPDTYMTEFYMLGGEGRAEDFPRTAAPGQQVSVTAGIANHERESANYRIEVWASDPWQADTRVQIGQAASVQLAPGQEERLSVSWQTPAIGDDQQVELLLFRDDSSEPYRRLRLWIAVQR